MTDSAHMQRALELARAALGSTAPNPAVGAVLCAPNGEVIGEGATKPVGGPHAEVVALSSARDQGRDTVGSTLYVTLEPCCHQGRTPPCTEAILAAGVRRVVVAMEDPFHAMQGKGLQQLRDAGVEVELGLCGDQAYRVVRGFCRTLHQGLPDVTLKVAMSLDGHVATSRGESQWVTGDLARQHGHHLRATHDAIMVGSGTVTTDDPRLTCRVAPFRDPVPVIMDSTGRTPSQAAVFQGSRRPVLVCGPQVQRSDGDVLHVPLCEGGVDLRVALQELGQRGLHRILVEGGPRLAASLLAADLVDTLYVFIAPVLIPGGRPWNPAPPLQHLDDAARYGAPTIETFGDDVLLRYDLTRSEGM
ncbi:MAG: bifunctional diaminohydroxyphosphoribosylaminopyrimidine deaminase/5-amino-6-(5-phosphoribosylamino)uracil reductase RibD [Myxococcota bacterium]